MEKLLNRLLSEYKQIIIDTEVECEKLLERLDKNSPEAFGKMQDIMLLKDKILFHQGAIAAIQQVQEVIGKVKVC